MCVIVSDLHVHNKHLQITNIDRKAALFWTLKLNSTQQCSIWCFVAQRTLNDEPFYWNLTLNDKKTIRKAYRHISLRSNGLFTSDGDNPAQDNFYFIINRVSLISSEQLEGRKVCVKERIRKTKTTLNNNRKKFHRLEKFQLI